MLQKFLSLFGMPDPDLYRRTQPLILINGLAEQGESWYPNRDVWQQHFDVHTPGVIVYGGPVMQERLAERQPINVAFLTDRLAEYLDRFVQSPPYHLVASSLGGQISIEYAARHPEKVGKMVLLCPSGFSPDERLPITEGARHRNYQGLVESTFFNPRFANPHIVKYYAQKFAHKPWRKALFETVRGTKSHSVLDKLTKFDRPTLVICGREDRIVETRATQEAVKDLPNFRYVEIPNCGHAPQLECTKLVNQLVLEFLGSPDPLAQGCAPAVAGS